ncbi:FAD-binding oxidoreductase [Paracoccus aestuarii]|nr:FAD-binding oxidoreductase [Paracoccus aestuarii]
MRDMATKDLLEAFRAVTGPAGVVDAPDAMAGYLTDWTGRWTGQAIAVLRPDGTDQVAALLGLCHRHGVAVTTQGGNTGIAGGATPIPDRDHVVLSLDRMQRILAIDPAARTATVQAGTVLQTLQEAVADHGLTYPLMFGARGSCTIGGTLATNAGGSNVLRYGTARALCLGVEAVLADGTAISDLQGLRKDNTGYDLRDLLIGSEGTLAVITAAVLRLHPAPVAVTTGFLSLSGPEAALGVLNALQDATGGLVEAFEYMPAPLIDRICAHTGARPPLAAPAPTGILLEAASTRPSDRDAGGLEDLVQDCLAGLMERGLVLDAVIAASGQQRRDLWAMREATAESIMAVDGYIFDLSLPLSQIAPFLQVTDAEVARAGMTALTVGHLGDGNLHYSIAPGGGAALGALRARILDRVAAMGGSFSAEHGIGQDKLDLMAAYRDPARLAAMRALRRAMDPAGILNPGKTIPDAP